MDTNFTPVPEAPKPSFFDRFKPVHALFALLAPFMGIAYWRMLFCTSETWQTTLFAVLYLLYGALFIFARGYSFSWETILFGGMTLITSLHFAFEYNSDDPASPACYLLLHLFALLFAASFKSTKEKRLVDSIIPSTRRAALVAPFTDIIALPCAIIAFFKNRADKTKNGRGRTALYILIGVVISIPLLILVFSLLSSDAFFGHYMEGIADFFARFDFWDLFEWINPISVTMMFVIFGVFCHPEKKYQRYTPDVTLPTTPASTVMIILCAVYALFFATQINGYICLFNGRIPEDTTYAEFARSGFFELCFASVINAAVIYFANILCGEKTASRISHLSGIMTVINLLLITTAASKMVLYIRVYGFTEKRFLTLWFMLLLAIIFALVLVRLRKPSFRLSRWCVFVTCALLPILYFVDFADIALRLNILLGK